MTAATNPNSLPSSLIDSYAETFADALNQSRHDLLHLSNLHRDFVDKCFVALDAGKMQSAVKQLSSYELYPQLVLQGLKVPDHDRRMLAAAWLALLGYTAIVDHELDQKGCLNGRSLIAASALLGWGVATFSRYTAGSPFADVFLDNINKAFAGQYEDIRVRGKENADRQSSDEDKGRGLVAAVAGFCTLAGLTDDRLIRSTEAILGTLQILDDLQDVEEDHSEGNLTIFVRIARECAFAAAPSTRGEMYSAIIRDPRTTSTMRQVTEGIDKALLILDGNRDRALIAFLSDLRDSNIALVRELEDYQRNPAPIREPSIMSRIEKMYMQCE
jgi:hypothetical protein